MRNPVTQTINKNDIDFIQKIINSITDSKIYELPSDYVERVRYLPAELTTFPGKFNFDKCPYNREILDCLSPLSPVQQIVDMKAVQTMKTTAVLENYLIYNIGSDPKSQLYISADEGLIKKGFKVKVERAIDSSNLRGHIFSQTKKGGATGDTTLEKEYPGGFLHGVGARNPGKLRSMSYQSMLLDELDGFPDKLGKEGDPVALAINRTNAYAAKRKILYISTPLITQTSKIYKLYLQGDQRNFYVPCKYCGKMQVLRWHGVTEDGKTYGIVFEVDKDFLPIYDTVGYQCQYCDEIMKNHDKSIIVNKGEWRPTKKSKIPYLRSYWINALYNPHGMYSWEDMVVDWTKCWDLEKNRVKDKEEYRTFRNTKQGLPFEEKGTSIKYDKAVLHRRTGFPIGHIPEKMMIEDTGSPALILTCAADPGKDKIYIDTKAWTQGGQSWTIDFFPIEGDVTNHKSELWSKLDKYLMEKVYISETGKKYKIMNTFIDSGWGKYTDVVYEFCKQYSTGVFAVKGERHLPGGITYKMFSKETLEKSGLVAGYRINTTKLKDRISRSMSTLQWDTGKFQPEWYPNFPENLHDDFFRMFEAETRVEVRDKITNQFKYVVWMQTEGADNHAFDTYVYNLAGLEHIADFVCRQVLNLPVLSWLDFWNYCKTEAFYYF
jgi:phage terminase large subunit GpA-like protein